MRFQIKKRGEIYHYSGTIEGRRYRESTGTSDRKKAERIAVKAEADAWKRRLDGPESVVTFANCLNAYLDAEKSDRFLMGALEAFGDTPVRKITGEAIRLAAQRAYPNAKGATRNRQFIVPAAAVINYGAELGWCSTIKVKRFPEAAVEKRPVSPEWVEAFGAQAEADGLPALAAICLFMFATGARSGEACALTWGDTDLDARTAVMEMPAKGGGEPWTRTAHLPPPVVVALANLPSNRHPDDLVFGYAGPASIKHTWDNVILRAGIERLTPHSCRHGFATTMLQRGIDPATIAKAGGWKDAATVIRYYLHALDDVTVTDAIFDTKLAHGAPKNPATIRIKRIMKS